MPPTRVSMIAGATGEWRIERILAIRGDPLPVAERLRRVEGKPGSPPEGRWILHGVRSHERYTTHAEKVQLTKIYSAYGALEKDGVAVTRRPMRSVHHTASKQALIGGGSKIPRPGEITMAHLGVKCWSNRKTDFSCSSVAQVACGY